MPVTDPVADMLTSIRNANTANKDTCEMPASKLKAEIARVEAHMTRASAHRSAAEELFKKS